MSKLEKSECQEIYNMIDKAGTGKVPATEIANFLRGVGLNPVEADLKKTLDELGGSKAQMTLEQAYAQYSSYFDKQKKHERHHYVEMFKIFDRQGNDTIMSTDVRNMLSSMGDKLTTKEIDSSLFSIENSQGIVNIGDYVDSVMSG